jgi:8-hydroxy-5-deazaflavin:NADPH oxidoreductase
MLVAVLGSGPVGRTLATGLAAAGHDVTLGSRAPDSPDLTGWAADSGVSVAQPAEATQGAEIVLLATPGAVAVDAVRAAGGEQLDAVLLDVSNPLDFADGTPRLVTGVDESVAEWLQEAFPRLRVVKSLCTVNNAVMVDPGLLAEPTTMFMAGADQAAKDKVGELLGSLGWPRDQILDLGDLTAARPLERNILLWLRIYQAVGTVNFNVRLVREA